MSIKEIKYSINLFIFKFKMWFIKFERDLPSKIDLIWNWEPSPINWNGIFWHNPAYNSYGRTSRFPREIPIKVKINRNNRFSFKSIPYNFGGAGGHGVRYEWLGLSIVCWNKIY